MKMSSGMIFGLLLAAITAPPGQRVAKQHPVGGVSTLSFQRQLADHPGKFLYPGLGATAAGPVHFVLAVVLGHSIWSRLIHPWSILSAARYKG
jgi:hypothetical protein